MDKDLLKLAVQYPFSAYEIKPIYEKVKKSKAFATGKFSTFEECEKILTHTQALALSLYDTYALWCLGKL